MPGIMCIMDIYLYTHIYSVKDYWLFKTIIKMFLGTKIDIENIEVTNVPGSQRLGRVY